MNLNKKELIRIEEVSLELEESEDILKSKIADILALPEAEIVSYEIARKNIDSRKKNIKFVYTLDVVLKDVKKVEEWNLRHRVRLHEPFVYEEKIVSKEVEKNIVVVGSGPCGLFATLILAKAGLKPLLIERGKDIDARVEDVDKFFQKGEFNSKSNVQFGEGGAGTFSDGKLYTLINDPRSKYVFTELIKAGAPKEIAQSGTPHIGTDKLRGVIKNIRKEIIKLGGSIRFEACLSDLEVNDDKLKAVILDNDEKIKVNKRICPFGSCRFSDHRPYGSCSFKTSGCY